jgi:predicted DsbA family dithiol-disulfide isomerase
MKPKIRIDVITDVVCPWCYIGEHRLHKAMEETKDKFDFELTLKPFELDPNTPKEGKDHKAYLVKLMGNEARVKEAHAMMKEMGEAEGLHYNFDKIKIIPNTLNAHRLIWLAKQYKVEEKVADALYRGNFSEGKDVNDLNILISIGSEYGIPKERLEVFFSGEEGRKEVILMEEDAHRANINSVPAFIVNNKYLIKGAQSATTLKDAFQRIAAEGVETSIKNN